MAHHPEMMCDVTAIAYDFKSRTGRVDMAVGNCVDMRGCIDVFERIDPKIKTIETFAGDQPDTSYHRSPTTKSAWASRGPEEA